MILSKILEIVKIFLRWVKKNYDNIILLFIAMLAILLSFAAGYITAKTQTKPPIIIENPI